MKSDVGKARKGKTPFDPVRLEKFITLFEALKASAPVHRRAQETTSQARTNLSFLRLIFLTLLRGRNLKLMKPSILCLMAASRMTGQRTRTMSWGHLELFLILRKWSNYQIQREELSHLLKNRHAVLWSYDQINTPARIRSKTTKLAQVFCCS